MGKRYCVEWVDLLDKLGEVRADLVGVGEVLSSDWYVGHVFSHVCFWLWVLSCNQFVSLRGQGCRNGPVSSSVCGGFPRESGDFIGVLSFGLVREVFDPSTVGVAGVYDGFLVAEEDCSLCVSCMDVVPRFV